MNLDTQSAPERAQSAPTGRIYPAGIAFLMEERPLLWYERPEDYDNLLREILAQMSPKDALECIFVKNLVDGFWEHRRIRRLCQTAINYAMPEAAGKVLVRGITYQDDRLRSRVERQAQGVAYGSQGEAAGDGPPLSEQMEQEHVTPEMIHFEAYHSVTERLTQLTRERERIENRLHWLLKNFEGRRATMAAMAKSLVERETAETVDFKEVS